MSEDYNWVNVDRKEYLCPADFGLGTRRGESCHEKSPVLGALKDLLANDWKGCRIFWMGDYSSIPETTSSHLFNVMKADCDAAGYPGDMIGMVYETYKNVSGLYKEAEANVRREIGYYLDEIASGTPYGRNEYKIDPKDPFKGLFQRNGRSSKYVINYTQKTGYSLGRTHISY